MANLNFDINTIVRAAKGNPGAADAMATLAEYGYTKTLRTILDYGIQGTDIYVLFSDLCGRDPFKVQNLVDRCPKDILIDACSRQDYSGRQLVAKYI